MQYGKATVFAVALLATSAQAYDVDQIVRGTPCLAEVRTWLDAGKHLEDFATPLGLTEEQCAAAKEVNSAGWFQHELELAQRDRVRAAQDAAEAKRQREQEAALARSSQARLDAINKRLAAMQRERADLAKRPPAQLGMTPEAVLNATRWGVPQRKAKVTTAKGVTETWFYGERGALVFTDGRITSIHEH